MRVRGEGQQWDKQFMWYLHIFFTYSNKELTFDNLWIFFFLQSRSTLHLFIYKWHTFGGILYIKVAITFLKCFFFYHLWSSFFPQYNRKNSIDQQQNYYFDFGFNTTKT